MQVDAEIKPYEYYLSSFQTENSKKILMVPNKKLVPVNQNEQLTAEADFQNLKTNIMFVER